MKYTNLEKQFKKKIEEIEKFGGKYDNFGMDDLKTRVEIEE